MKKILLAEDDEDDQEIFREILSSINSEIQLSIFENGEELVKYMTSLSPDALPDLIVMDQNMPRLKGSEAISQLRDHVRFAHIPMVIYTTYHDSKFEQHCKTLGIELLLKPDTFGVLKSMIQDLIERYTK